MSRMPRALAKLATSVPFEEISIDDRASVARVVRSVCWHVAETMGVPPHRFLALRLERAETPLTLGVTSLTGIALAACFSSHSDFTRAF